MLVIKCFVFGNFLVMKEEYACPRKVQSRKESLITVLEIMMLDHDCRFNNVNIGFSGF